jgi:flagellar motor switch protein FliG
MAAPARQTLRAADLAGPQKAAILVMYLHEQVARAVLEHLTVEAIEDIGLAMAEVENVPIEVIEQVVSDFVRDVYPRTAMPKPGRKFALERLPSLLAPERSERVMNRLRRHISTKFQELVASRPPATVATLLLDEHPQTQAIALLLMGPDNAAMILSYLDENDQYDLSLRMARIERIPAELADDVESSITAALEDRGAGLHPIEGLNTAAQILGRVHSDFQQGILEKIAGTDFELSEMLKRRMMVFKDLAKVDKKGIQAILKVVERQTLLVALRGADGAVKELFLGNMSQRAAQDLREEMEIMAPVPRSEVETAQEEIVKVALQLNEEGTIRLPFGGADDMV